MHETIPKSRLDEIAARAREEAAYLDGRVGFTGPLSVITTLRDTADTIEALSAQAAEHDAHVARLIEQGQQAEYERGKAVDALAVAEAKVEELTKAAKEVEDWWLEDGRRGYVGAPYCIFAIRRALSPEVKP